MQLARGCLIIGVLAVGLASAAPLEEQNAGYLFRMFRDSDDIHVASHLGRYEFLLKNNTRMNVHINHERVTIPAVSAPPGSQDAVDAITTASRPIAANADAHSAFVKHRNEFSGDLGVNNLSAGYYMSKESDYFAQQVRGGIDQGFLEDNFNLSLGASYGWDQIEPLSDQDTPGTIGTRTVAHGNVVATQLVTPGTLLRVGAEISAVRGLQHNPYRNVYAGGGHEPERHPDRRTRRDVFLRVNQYLTNRSSVKASYRFYNDDWGVRSHTIGGRLAQYLTPKIRAGYRYRYYSQNESWFFAPEYELSEGLRGYRTGDYRLGVFSAHLFGAQLAMDFPGVPAKSWGHLGLLLKYERYFNSNDFSANIFESALSYKF